MSETNRKNNRRKISPSEGADSERKTASSPLSAPVIFHYHDYVQYLNDWLKFKKATERGFSVRKLAGAREISVGYLPMVLSGQRPLSNEALNKLLPALDLSRSEQQFFECIHALGISQSQEERVECLRRMKRYSAYREHYPNESEVYRYLTKWYYTGIRELSTDPEFKLDAEWVQGRLRLHVPLQEIKDALQFLTENKYIVVAENGTIRPPDKHLNCEGGIYKVALTQYHRQLLSLAEKSIENANSSERQITGHTFAISEKKFEAIRSLMEKMVAEIQTIAESDDDARDSVYHLEMALFPLTKNKTEKDK